MSQIRQQKDHLPEASIPDRPPHILPLVVFAQFAGTSVWFATNAVIPELEAAWQTTGLTVWLTSAVQLGFILGSAVVAVTRLADRVPGRLLFLAATVLAAGANAAVLLADHASPALAARFVCGIALAGIYPVGMKVVAGWYDDGLGSALGWLVGALVLGTAFPHLLRAGSLSASLDAVILGTSGLALAGGLAMALGVPTGPHAVTGTGPSLSALPDLAASGPYRAAALGYFGHMWELYTFWALVPALFATTVTNDPRQVALLAFFAVAIGAVGCVVGGWLADRYGSRRVALAALFASLLCCLVAPGVLTAGSPVLNTAFLLFWGLAVVADSPQLSTLTAQGAPPALRGTGLALATSIGFGLTVVSLAVVTRLPLAYAPWLLLPGPLLGAVALGPSQE